MGKTKESFKEDVENKQKEKGVREGKEGRVYGNDN